MIFFVLPHAHTQFRIATRPMTWLKQRDMIKSVTSYQDHSSLNLRDLVQNSLTLSAVRAVESGGARGAVAPPGPIKWPSNVESPVEHKFSALSTK